MVIFVKPNGSTVVENDVIGLGTTVGKIAIVAPTRQGAFVEVLFSPPSGVIVPPIYAAPMMSTEAEDLGIYLCDIAPGIASASGRVRYQISFTLSGGGKEITPEGTFTIQPGVVSIPPENPTQSMYEEIRNAMIAASVNYTDVVAKLEKALSSAEIVEINLEEINAAKAETLRAASDAKSSENSASNSATSAAASARSAQTEADRAKSEADRAMEKDPTVPAWAKQPAKPSYTASEVGAAPAGFGLGTVSAPLISTEEELDLTNKSGFYRVSISGKNWGGVLSNGGSLVVNSVVDGRTCQTVYLQASNTVVRRYCYNSVWNEWEIENPPMQLGVEYRTTERFNGKPVYVVAMDLGILPTSGDKDVYYSVSLKCENIVSYDVIISNHSYGARSLPTFASDGSIMAYAWSLNATIRITVLKDMSGYNGRALVKYVK